MTPDWADLWRRAFGPRCAVHEWRWERGYALCDEVKPFRLSPCQWIQPASEWQPLRPVGGPASDVHSPSTGFRLVHQEQGEAG